MRPGLTARARCRHGRAGHCPQAFPRAAYGGTWERSRAGGVQSQSPLRFVRNQLGADSSRAGRVGGLAFHFRWSPRSLSGPLGPRQRGGGRGLGPAQGAAERPQPQGFHSFSPGCTGPRFSAAMGAGGKEARQHGCCSADPGPAHCSAPRASLRGEATSLGTKPRNSPSTSKPGLSLRAPVRLPGPPGGLPLFPCCTTVTVAASSAIMKGRQCAGERREPGSAGVTAGGEEPGRPAGSRKSGAGVAALFAVSESAGRGVRVGLGHPRQ